MLRTEYFFAHSRAAAIYLLAYLAICGLSLESAKAGIISTAVSYGSNSVPPIPQSTTTIAGETVSQSSTATGVTSQGVIFGTVSGSSSAATDYGVNRVALTAGLIWINNPFSGIAYTASIAGSSWDDRWTISGGTPADVVTLSLSGRTTYDLALFGGAQIGAPATQFNLQVGAFSFLDSEQLNFTPIDFATNAGIGYFDWGLSIDVHPGDPINIFSAFNTYIEGSLLGAGLGAPSKQVSFDAMHTSLLNSATVPTGYSITSQFGELVAHNGAFVYSGVLAEITAVPEPASLALLALGLAGLGFTRRRAITSK